MDPKPEKKTIRNHFIFLLLSCITGFLVMLWFFVLIIAVLAGETLFYSIDSLAVDLFQVFILPILLCITIAALSIAMSIILRQKWWIALLGTIFLLGMPLIGFAITWIGSKLAYPFYLPTSRDMQQTKRILKMTVKPKNGQPSTEEEYAPAGLYFFTLRQSTIAALFGGFFGGGLSLAINHKNLGEKSSYRWWIAIGLLLQFGGIAAFFAIVDYYRYLDYVMILPFLLAIPVLIYLWHHEAQETIINNAIANQKAEQESWWRVIGLISYSIFFDFVCILPIGLLIELLGDVFY